MKRRSGISFDDIMDGPDEAEPVTTKAAEPATAPDAAGAEVPDAEHAAPEIVPLTFHISPKDRVRLKVLCAETGLSLQKIGHAAFTMFLNARGLPGLDPRDASVPDGRKGKRKRR